MAALAVFPPGYRLTDAAGVPISGAAVEFYQVGSSLAYTVYGMSDLSLPLGNIVYTDSAGYPVSSLGGTTRTLVYVSEDPYRIVIKDADGVVIADHDNALGAVEGGGGGGDGGGDGITQAAADVRYVRNPNALTAVTTLAVADLFPLWQVSDGANRAIRFDNFIERATERQRTQGHVFASGVRCLFAQAAAPIGWTKVTTHNNTALRLVNTTGGGTGGSQNFTTTFTSVPVTGSVGATTLAINQLPSHQHTIDLRSQGQGATHSQVLSAPGSSNDSDSFGTQTTSAVGSGFSHTHSFTGNALNFNVQYVDVLLCEKS